MGLVPGTQVGPYEIQAAVGAGGVGQVYRARDVPLSVLMASLSARRSRALDKAIAEMPWTLAGRKRFSSCELDRALSARGDAKVVYVGLVHDPRHSPPSGEIMVVLDWAEDLKRLAPGE